MSDLTTGLSATAAVLTVELPFNDVVRGDKPPAPLERAQAAELGEAISTDLRQILDDIEGVGLILPAALYDLTEVLRPGLPMIEILMEVYRGSLPDSQFTPHVLSLGTHGGRFPIPSIAPLRRPGSGPLLGIPFVFVGERERIKELGEQLESRLLEQGRAGMQTDHCVRQYFGIEPENLAYATIHDLCAVLKVQLEHSGMPELWTLLEYALYRPGEAQRVSLPSGNLFIQNGARVYSPFYTFDQWARQNDTTADEAIDGYTNWARQQRIFTAGLEAHGLELVRISGETSFEGLCENKSLARAEQAAEPEADYFVETGLEPQALENVSIIALTEHSTEDLGPLAYTVLVQGKDGRVLHLSNEYPLRPEGIMAIRDRWRLRAQQLKAEYDLARPGGIVLAEDGQHLVPYIGSDTTH